MSREPTAALLAALLAAVVCATPAALATGQVTGPAAATLPVAANARAAHMERCHAEHRRLYPRMAADAVGNSCGYRWEKVEAAGPLADLVLAIVPARAGERLTPGDLRARLPGSR